MKYTFCVFIVLITFMSCQPNQESNSINFTSEKINIDGKPNEASWSITEWKTIDQKWLGADYTKDDFQGRYKALWNDQSLFVLAEIQDDTLVDTHADGLIKYWDDDCLEIFIDEDASGGNHQYNNNAFAYHIGLNGQVVDLGPDSLAHYYDHITSARSTKGNTSIWELSISLYDKEFTLDGQHEKVKLIPNKEIGFAIAYCDNDHSEERENFIGSTFVEGEDKNRGWIDASIFEKIVLTK